MAYDRNRPVPWRRLLTELAVVSAVIALLFATVLEVRDAGSYLGLVIGGVMYLVIGAVLAKLGYQRATYRDLRAARKAPTPAQPAAAARPRPAPTRRTSTGPSQRPHRSTKARRR